MGNAGCRGKTNVRTVLAGVCLVILLALLATFLIHLSDQALIHPLWINTRVRVQSLGRGADLYRKENGYYPGQREIDQLVSEGGKYTGSQLMAMAMYLIELTPEGPKGVLRGGYDTYKEEFITRNFPGYPYTLSDLMSRESAMAICYYVPRPDKEGVDRFVEADNAVYTDRAKGGNFRVFIAERCMKGGSHIPDFLLISPGPDRKYFTDDDITNF